MKFIKLEIQNLASLDRQGGETINFEEGALGESTIFSIVGPTGSGKSTILDAICLALYNRAPRYPRKKGDRNQNIEIYGDLESDEKSRLAPTDSRNILTRGKKDGYSKLTFLANNGVVYRAEWYVHQKTKKYDEAITSLYRISMTEEGPAEEIDDWDQLPQIIGLDYEQFLRTVLIAQGSFANFLTAKENERYELLEKLIGCEELYSNIAIKIKSQRDSALAAYNEIAAQCAAQEKDLIPEEELPALNDKLAVLEEIEKKAKEELSKLSEALGWYSINERITENLTRFNTAYNEAIQKMESLKDKAARLSLHDSTLPAVAICREIHSSKLSIAKYENTLANLGDVIASMEKEISNEIEVNLENLRKDAKTASDELERHKPHINNARQIKAELQILKTSQSEKANDMTDAVTAKNKADKDVADNQNAIKNASSVYQTAIAEKQSLLNRLESELKEKQTKANEAISHFTTENAKLEEGAATRLQHAKTAAEKVQSDLREAIRVQSELKKKLDAKKSNEDQLEQLIQRNKQIDKELEGYNIDSLSKELETLTRTYTLMTSEKWNLHRNHLTDGEPCPLCGAIHHPYHDAKVVAPIIDDMKSLIDKKQETLDSLTKSKDKLTNEQNQNKGKIAGIKTVLGTLSKELEELAQSWLVIHNNYNTWVEDADLLRELQPGIEKDVEEASRKLDDYNTLVSSVEKLRKAKEKAEKALHTFELEATEKKQEAEKIVNEANTTQESEKGKTANLITQQTEKNDALKTASDALQKVTREFGEKVNALKAEIGDKDPDTFETQLTNAKDAADLAVTKKTEDIVGKREQLKELQGQEKSAKESMKNESEALLLRTEELNRWLVVYNEDEKHTDTLTSEDIALLMNATDNWEEIRACLNRAQLALTSAQTTLKNERNLFDEHQQKKPEEQKDVLLTRKAELKNHSNAELVNLTARFQRHKDAKLQMGNMYDKRAGAELLKKEWDEITDAIGGDGKTLRKIAQCYTLRFLIEHANVEIRKFNSRYELQQVKNSLGIRVIDHDRADDVRDTTSLSGGETFIVSLGLALGLSALSSRNISFENLFIDEGFGTLDPDMLATVIDSLAMLQSSQGKKVGVISHTDTMSERISTQIRIIKNGNSGSSHIEIYP